ncbi:Hypothetical protein FKW44_017170 [Caligus rogercresseyi]|uniref:Uncharacterized protein n=1 Tax=Caligus rogercresseyi TaxID=217165 RepID=A0A7T8H3K7_CALRO|nr:Hypothetical protein FKW44_017170 [Caligus rogercresseyi]
MLRHGFNVECPGYELAGQAIHFQVGAGAQFINVNPTNPNAAAADVLAAFKSGDLMVRRSDFSDMEINILRLFASPLPAAIVPVNQVRLQISSCVHIPAITVNILAANVAPPPIGPTDFTSNNIVQFIGTLARQRAETGDCVSGFYKAVNMYYGYIVPRTRDPVQLYLPREGILAGNSQSLLKWQPQLGRKL